MKNINYYLPLSALVLVSSVHAEIPQGAIEGNVQWQLQQHVSDDFNSSTLNTDIWENAPKKLNVGAWSFVQPNAFLKEGKLNIMATQETHTRPFRDVCQKGATVQRELYYKSGAVQTHAEDVYGYYEASIKGVKIFPGLSPAFWLYSDGHPYPDRDVPGSVDYSEIDIVELQQADWHGPKADDADPINVMDHNLHARIIKPNGKKQWRRPKPFPKEQLLRYEAPFDPSKGFHTYAVENRKDVISWYVDGKLIGQKANLFWHRPMHVIFSMGMRRQFIKYNGKCQRADPNANHIVTEGFPEDATMQVDYVKVWKARPSVWLKGSLENNYSKQKSLAVTLSYHAGSDDTVIAKNYQGLTLNLIEKDSAGNTKVVHSVSDKNTLVDNNIYAGEADFVMTLDNITPSAKLAQGHYYQLQGAFSSSQGKDISFETKKVLITE